MIKFAAFVISTIFASSAFAATYAPSSTLTCTRDYNAWGRASMCQCPTLTDSETFYDSRVGACVSPDLISFTDVEGHIKPEVNPAGFTIGYTLTTDANEVYAVVAPVAVRAQFEEADFSSRKVRISAELIQKTDDNSKRPAILIFDSLSAADTGLAE